MTGSSEFRCSKRTSSLSPLRRSPGTEIHQTNVRVTTCASACPRSRPVSATSDRSTGPSIVTETKRTPLRLRTSSEVGGVLAAAGGAAGAAGGAAAAGGLGAGRSSRWLRCFHHQTPDAAPAAKSIKRRNLPAWLFLGGSPNVG